ncbi:MAG: cytochrome d ubiquinol oxidase subunit II [Oceanidesulfovibrio sp.]
MLEITWFILWGVLWALYFVLDGFDLGIGILLPFLGKSERDRRVMYNAQGPFWDANEVWLITAGGVTFAAFPGTYAVLFSSLYTPLLLLLFALIIRGVTFEFRHLGETRKWKRLWDTCHFVGSFLAALLLGVAFANIFMGIPIDAEGVNQGTLLTLLNSYGLVGGVVFVLVFSFHGSLWLAVKAHGEMEERARRVARSLWFVVALGAVLFLFLSAVFTDLYANYLANPLLFAIPLLAVAGLILARMAMGQDKYWKAFLWSGLFIVGVAFFGIAGIYPALLPSSLDPAYSMTIANSASSPLTLKIMLGVTLVMVPIVLLYQLWVYRTFSHKLETDEDLYY